MQRYFGESLDNNVFILKNDDIYHITKVMRMKVNDEVEIVYNKKVYLCQIESLNPLKCTIKKELDMDNENTYQIILIQSMVNETKMDLILQKGTEVGVNEFYPYNATNSVIKDNGKMDKKIIRWQRIVKEASEQSKRNIIPVVHDLVKISDINKIQGDLKLLLSVNECQVTLKSILQKHKDYGTIIIVVGPEGGFTKEEEEKFIENGYIRTSIGKRVLRTETASVVVSSMINYEWMV